MKKIDRYQDLISEEKRLKEKLKLSNQKIKDEFEQSIQPSYLFNELISKPIQSEFNFKFQGNIIGKSYDFIYRKFYSLFEPKNIENDKEWKAIIRENLSNLYQDNRDNLVSITALLIEAKLMNFLRKK